MTAFLVLDDGRTIEATGQDDTHWTFEGVPEGECARGIRLHYSNARTRRMNPIIAVRHGKIWVDKAAVAKT